MSTPFAGISEGACFALRSEMFKLFIVTKQSHFNQSFKV
jgi:hypothetical protein